MGSGAYGRPAPFCLVRTQITLAAIGSGIVSQIGAQGMSLGGVPGGSQ